MNANFIYGGSASMQLHTHKLLLVLSCKCSLYLTFALQSITFTEPGLSLKLLRLGLDRDGQLSCHTALLSVRLSTCYIYSWAG